MIALDTNVWVRYVTNDEPGQAERALDVISKDEDVFVAKTTLLEVEWVLRSAYKLSSDNVIMSLRHILGLPNVQAEMPDQVEKAINFYEKGLDFADALHLASSPEGVSFFIPSILPSLNALARSKPKLKLCD
jgi:predicted nucleic-acid-binding protein